MKPDEYVEFFHPDFAGVTGESAALRRVAAQYGVFYELGEETASVSFDPGFTDARCVRLRRLRGLQLFRRANALA